MKASPKGQTDDVAATSSAVLAARQALGLSQQAFANLVGASNETIHRWEKGYRTPSKTKAWELVGAVTRANRIEGEKLALALKLNFAVVAKGQAPAEGMPIQSIEDEVAELAETMPSQKGRPVDIDDFSRLLVPAVYRRILLARPGEQVDAMCLSGASDDVRLRLRVDHDVDMVFAAVRDAGYHAIVTGPHDRFFGGRQYSSHYLLVRPGFGALEFKFFHDRRGGRVSIDWTFLGLRSEAIRINDLMRPHVIRVRRRRGHAPVYAMLNEGGGISIKRVGYVGEPLRREGYPDSVLSQYDDLVREFRAPHPTARFAVLDGPPGTGKTYLLRAFAQDVSQAVRVVIVFPHMLRELADPSLMPMLLRQCTQGHRLVIVIEDGDTTIIKRDRGNMSDLSVLLNLTEGMLGAALDLRFIVTTNSSFVELDPAITRKGRLLHHIHFPLLSPEQALSALKSLRPEVTQAPEEWVTSVAKKPGFRRNAEEPTGVSLGDVYAHAKSLGWTPTKLSDMDSECLVRKAKRGAYRGSLRSARTALARKAST